MHTRKIDSVTFVGRLAALIFWAHRTLLVLIALGFGLIASTSTAFAQGGGFDDDFGIDGKVTADLTGPDGEDEATDVLELVNDNIILVGLAFNPANDTFDFALTQLDEDGIVDTSFGTAGIVLTDLGGTHDRINGAAIYPGGKIIVVGSAEGPPDEFKFAVARYNADGSLDTTFGGGAGFVTTAFPTGTFAEAEAVVVEDGKIIVAGAAGEEFDPVEGEIVQPDFAVARYNADGSLDTTFGSGGLVVTDFSGSDISFDEASDVAVEDDYIVVGGFSLAEEEADDEENFALARYNWDGTLDTAFGTGGLVTTDFDGNFDVIESIVVEDEMIIAAGITVIDLDPVTEEAPTEEDFALARYNWDGSLDGTFGTGGLVVTDFREGFDLGTDVDIIMDHIVVVGVTADPEAESEDEEEDFGIALYDMDGELVADFGDGGLVITDFAGLNEQAAAVAIEQDNIIAAGSTADPVTGEDFAVARYESEL